MSQKSKVVFSGDISEFRAGVLRAYLFPIQVNGARRLPQITVVVSMSGQRDDKRRYINVTSVEKGHPLFHMYRTVAGEDPEMNKGLYLRFPIKKGRQSKHASYAKKCFLKELSRYLRAVREGGDVTDWREVLPLSRNFSRRDATLHPESIRPQPQVRMAS